MLAHGQADHENAGKVCYNAKYVTTTEWIPRVYMSNDILSQLNMTNNINRSCIETYCTVQSSSLYGNRSYKQYQNSSSQRGKGHRLTPSVLARTNISKKERKKKRCTG